MNTNTSHSKEHMESILNSSRWAVYGDVIGFISELANESLLKRRINSSRVSEPTEWKRLIGGRYGASVFLPKGCYSDDTQLRLATSRSIRGDGDFDVEVFAKVELPVWLSYALGAGRGSKAAAASLSRQSTNWFSNFFEQKNTNYFQAGGNGAAMRIQPHVWSSTSRLNSETYLLDVIRNSICTHGHPRGFLGAVFHAYCLASTIETNEIANIDVWERAIDVFLDVPDIINGDSELSAFWRPVWEDRTGRSLKSSIMKVRDECLADIDSTLKYTDINSEGNYHRLVSSLGGLRDDQRGSGTKTAILASALAWMYRNDNPEVALQASANLLNSDTDTIGTMAGAILGAGISNKPRIRVEDQDYIDSEALRLYQISCGKQVSSFQYPNLYNWSPPKAQLDALGMVGDKLCLAGIGYGTTVSELYASRSSPNIMWQWVKLDFGQTVLVKRREELKQLVKGNAAQNIKDNRNSEAQSFLSGKKVMNESIKKPTYQKEMLNRNERIDSNRSQKIDANMSINQLTTEAIKSGFDEALIGYHILWLTGQENGIEKVIAYSAIIAKAKISRDQFPSKAKNNISK
ncbi:MAG: ADP-ribosylglycohydrolase family protein [Pseudomonadota bacterium]